MQLLESIVLRVTENEKNAIDALLEEFASEMTNDSQGVEITLYRHATLGTDVCIQLRRNVDQHTRTESPLGMRLAASLKTFGLVDHTYWVEWEKLQKPQRK